MNRLFEQYYNEYIDTINKYDKLKKDNEQLLVLHKKILNDNRVNLEYSKCIYNVKNAKKKLDYFKKYGYDDVVELVEFLNRRDDLYDKQMDLIKKYNENVCQYVKEKYDVDYTCDIMYTNQLGLGLRLLSPYTGKRKDDKFAFPTKDDEKKFQIYIPNKCKTNRCIPEYAYCTCKECIGR